MTRREFIALFGALAASPLIWPMPSQAQQRGGRIARIGIIDNAPIWDNFRKALRELGHIEGQTVAFEYRATEGKPERMALAAADLVRLPVDLIATFGTPPSRAAKEATSTIPIVAIGIGDPVKAGLVANLARPGGNVTGNTILSPDVSPKRLQLLKEVLPAIRSLAFLWNPDNASHESILEELKAAAPVAGLTLIAVEASGDADFDGAFAAILRARAGAFLMTNDPFHLLHFQDIIEFLRRNRIPSMFQARETVAAGGFMSYGASLPDLFRRAAFYAHKILTGTWPADLPVEQAAKFELAINLRTAKALGLTIPESFLLRVDEVIE